MMENRKVNLILAILFSISACHSNNSAMKNQKEEDCGKQISKSLGYVNTFYFKKDPVYLDSALQILKGVENKSMKYNDVILNDEVYIYFFQKKFSSALNVLNAIPDSIYPFPSFKKVLEFKIKAKEAETNKIEKKQKECFYALISIYQHYLDDNQQTFEMVLKQSDMSTIKQSPNIDFVLTEIFYYKAKIKTINKAISEIDSFQRRINGNSTYFEELKKNIKRNDGKAIGIILY